MFTCVKLKNFKSFNDITLDLTDKNNRPKSLVLIYGENGIGKSNLASAFYMLSETLRTMEFRDLGAGRRPQPDFQAVQGKPLP